MECGDQAERRARVEALRCDCHHKTLNPLAIAGWFEPQLTVVPSFNAIRAISFCVSWRHSRVDGTFSRGLGHAAKQQCFRQTVELTRLGSVSRSEKRS